MLEIAENVVSQSVATVSQTYVDALKKDGIFDKDAQQQAFEMSKDKIYTLLTADTLQAVQNNYGDVDEWIVTKIEETIIETHNKTLTEIKDSLQDIKNSLNEQKDVNLKQLRHTIVQTCEDCLEKGEISIGRLRSLEEMYSEYVDVFHANGYVKILVERVLTLKIVGREE